MGRSRRQATKVSQALRICGTNEDFNLCRPSVLRIPNYKIKLRSQFPHLLDLYFFEYMNIYSVESVHRAMMDCWGYFPLDRLKVSPNGNNYAADVSPLFSHFLFIRSTIWTQAHKLPPSPHCSLQGFPFP